MPESTLPLNTPLKRALDQNEMARDAVEQSADGLLVVNTVLQQELPGDSQSGEVAQALQASSEIESRLQESAEELAQVNDALEQEIDERLRLERELAATKAALVTAKAKAGGA